MSEFDRLSSLRVELDDTTLDLQQATILGALARRRGRRTLPRRRLVAAIVTALLVLQTGVVWAAEDTLPGDALYGVKRAWEAPRSWFDHDVRVRNRLAEANALFEEDPVGAGTLLDEAANDVDDDTQPALVDELEGLRLQLRTRARDGSGSGSEQGGNGGGSGGGNGQGGGP
ncbi:MAG: hypothetical protein HKN46_04980 [Acidimicrobiia bacterium]|nr:hypothetical protein [Acidimicrobiia bacterium]